MVLVEDSDEVKNAGETSSKAEREKKKKWKAENQRKKIKEQERRTLSYDLKQEANLLHKDWVKYQHKF